VNRGSSGAAVTRSDVLQHQEVIALEVSQRTKVPDHGTTGTIAVSRAQGASAQWGEVMRRILLSAFAVTALALGFGPASAAPIARIIGVQVTDLKAYAHEVDVLRGQFKKAGVMVTLRIWRARFAGSDAGNLFVAVEMPDLATLAKVDELQKSNADIAATMQKIGAMRKIVSDSLYEEVQ